MPSKVTDPRPAPAAATPPAVPGALCRQACSRGRPQPLGLLSAGVSPAAACWQAGDQRSPF